MDPGVELTPMMRLVERSTLEIVWEFLDDQDSSRGAWWLGRVNRFAAMF